MRRVFAAGTFDGLHDGHRDYFRQARGHGDELVVVIARDTTVERVKGRRPQYGENERLAAVQAEPLVNRALLGREGGEKFAVLLELRPDVVFLGYDQPASEKDIRAFLDANGLLPTRILRGVSYRPEIYKSSLLISS